MTTQNVIKIEDHERSPFFYGGYIEGVFNSHYGIKDKLPDNVMDQIIEQIIKARDLMSEEEISSARSSIKKRKGV